VALAGDADKEVRLAAIRALGEIGTPDAVSALQTFQKDPDAAVRAAAVEAIAAAASAKAVPAPAKPDTPPATK
jgi:HEAT repeat protein